MLRINAHIVLFNFSLTYLKCFSWCLLSICRLINHFEWHGTFLILGAIVLLNIILGALFRPLLPSSSASEATTTSNQDAVNLDCDVTSSLYKISDKENGNLSLQNSFTNGTNQNDMSLSCNASFIDSENNAQKSPVIIILFVALMFILSIDFNLNKFI